jgi:hypothetical protein
MKDCMKNQTPSQLMSTPDVTPDVPREGGKSSGTSSRACGAKTAAHLAANLAGDTDLAGNLSGHQVKIVPWFRAFRPYFLSFQSSFSIATAYYQSRNLVRKLSSYGRWFWLAFTPSCQPHYHQVVAEQLGSVTVWKRVNSPLKTLSGAKTCVFLWVVWLLGLPK